MNAYFILDIEDNADDDILENSNSTGRGSIVVCKIIVLISMSRKLPFSLLGQATII